MPVASAVRRVLPQVRRTGRRMCDPVTGVPLSALAVVDVDLDTGTVLPVPARTPFESDPEGVHALVWFHGTPLGEVTLQGTPAELLPDLVARSRDVLGQALVSHLLLDALQTPDGLQQACEHGLLALDHPEPEATAPPPTVTVAVCTRDRPDLLRACLTALADLEHPVLEVLVVDNGSVDHRTREVAQSFPFVRYVHEPRPGLDWARNRALTESRGEVVAYTDDDVLVHPTWVTGLLRAFADEPHAAAVTGLVVPAELSTPAQVLFEVRGGFGRGFNRRWFSADVAGGESAAEVFAGSGVAGTGANMAFRRSTLMALGGFDPALDVGTPSGGGGDLEAFFRVVAAGGLLVYEPSAVVRHAHRSTLPALARQLRGDGTGSTAYQLGAGRAYGARERRAFQRKALWWLVHGQLKRLAVATLAPDLMPPSLPRAEVRGVLDALTRRYYRQGQHAARDQPGPHPDLVRPTGNLLRARAPDPVVTVELLADDLAGPGAPLPATATRRTRVRVLRGGTLEHTFVVWTRSLPLSRPHLRACVVDALGPALLVPGLSWDGCRGRVHGHDSAPPLAPLALGRPPRQPQREGLCESLLRGPIHTEPVRLPRATPVSILLATRDRPDQLAQCLAALTRQGTDRPVQLVVVDNSPDPQRTAQILRDHPGVELVHEPRPGLSRARNAGFPRTTGQVVVFTDDDVVPGDGWLDCLLAPFSDPTVAACSGNVLPTNLEALAPQVFEDYGGLGRGPHRQVFLPSWLGMHRGAVPMWIIGATANAAVRRDVLEQLGPWVENLGPGVPAGVGEDTEYFYRILRSGGTIAYEPRAVILHSHRADTAALARQLHDYSAGHVAYHLEIARRYGDLRGLRRVLLALPRDLLRQSRAASRGHDDVPPEILRAQVVGYLSGPLAWARSLRAALR